MSPQSHRGWERAGTLSQSFLMPPESRHCDECARAQTAHSLCPCSALPGSHRHNVSHWESHCLGPATLSHTPQACHPILTPDSMLPEPSLHKRCTVPVPANCTASWGLTSEQTSHPLRACLLPLLGEHHGSEEEPPPVLSQSAFESCAVWV